MQKKTETKIKYYFEPKIRKILFSPFFEEKNVREREGEDSSSKNSNPRPHWFTESTRQPLSIQSSEST